VVILVVTLPIFLRSIRVLSIWKKGTVALYLRQSRSEEDRDASFRDAVSTRSRVRLDASGCLRQHCRESNLPVVALAGLDSHSTRAARPTSVVTIPHRLGVAWPK